MDRSAASPDPTGGQVEERAHGWVSQARAGSDHGEDVGPDHHDDDADAVDDPVTGSPAAVLLPDTSIAGPPQALGEHPDDQGPPLLGNQDCTPPG